MNILLFNYMETTAPGGINKVVNEIAKNMSKNGHEVTVLQPNPLNLQKEELHEGFKIIRINSILGNSLYNLTPETYFYLKKSLNELNPDIIHLHGYHRLFYIGALYSLLKLNFKGSIVFSPHFDIFSHDTFGGKYLWDIYNQIGKKVIKYPHKVIAASDYESENVKKILNVPEETITVIPHGVERIDFNHGKHQSDTLNLLYVGYLLELKGVHHIIEAVHELVHKRDINVCLNVIGEGPYEEELKKLANKLDVNRFINWVGFIPPSDSNKLFEYFKKSDIFLLLSQSENYGIVVPESLTMGTPAIVTNRTALKEFLDEPGCFSVEYPPDPKKVADLIVEIRENDTKVGPFSNKIRIWDEICRDYEELYKQLLTS